MSRDDLVLLLLSGLDRAYLQRKVREGEGKAKEYIYRSFCALPRRRRDGVFTVDFVRCQGESISPSRFPLVPEQVPGDHGV